MSPRCSSSIRWAAPPFSMTELGQVPWARGVPCAPCAAAVEMWGPIGRADPFKAVFFASCYEERDTECIRLRSGLRGSDEVGGVDGYLRKGWEGDRIK